ncbi:MAG: hypothetical protein HY318_04025, partial [Armatimonadetes bacterium]|nr:hypothetical protein [Armatimonadota bacterium]
MTRDSWSPLRWTLICCYAVLYGGGPSVAAANPTVTLIVPKSVPGPAGFGASEIERSLTGRGWQVERSTGSLPSHEPAIVLALWPNQSSTSRKLAPPSLPESYRIVREGRSRIVITGSDATGLMYGALDVSEQLRWSPAKEAPLDSIQARQKSPYLELRGVNQFLHKQAMDNPTSWYYSMTFWQEYLNALARSRHNFLDLHALYDMVTTGFPNLFPHVIHLEEYPQADLGREQTEKNLKVLKTVIVMAADRGIKVGIMNYNAGANVPGDKLADYTSKCVERLLKELPGLWAFGFRIGESGQPEDFFKRSYIAGVENSGVKVNLFTRSWIASRQKIMEIADRHKGRFLVEIKYNGEQLGLPYQVQGERMADWGSYSYQQYTDLPRNYSILWQVRANGTHRIFQWGDPEFARRVARTCRLGDGAGFSLEPISAYYPMEQYYLNPKTFPKPFFRWEFERNWFWYDTWGRTGYDPTVPDSVFENLFSERFGGQAGPSLFKSVVAASKIVPLIYAYHCLGPDHRNMAPEFEIGNDHGGRRNADGSGERVHNGLNGFLNAEPLDDTVMVSPRRYVEEAIKGSPYPPVGPQEVSLVLEDFVNRARQALPKESELPAGAREAYKDASLDVEALSSLAQYYAAKIRAVTCLELYHRTGDLQSLNTSRQLCQKALDSWDELSGHTEEHFSPIIERIRMFTTSFTWREEGKDLSRELDEVNAVWRKAVAPPASPGGAPKLSHTPRQLQDPGKEVKVSLTALSQNATMQPVLHYRSTNGPYSGNAMSPVPEFEHVFEGTMPVKSVKDGWIEYYFTASSDGATAILPEAGEGRPYRVTLTRDLTPPSVTSTQSHLTPHRDKVTVNASVRDSSGVGSVDLLYRPMPSFYAWQSVPMRKVGADRYRADAPLTPEGLLYRIVAVDKKGV